MGGLIALIESAIIYPQGASSSLQFPRLRDDSPSLSTDLHTRYRRWQLTGEQGYAAHIANRFGDNDVIRILDGNLLGFALLGRHVRDAYPALAHHRADYPSLSRAAPGARKMCRPAVRSTRAPHPPSNCSWSVNRVNRRSALRRVPVPGLDPCHLLLTGSAHGVEEFGDVRHASGEDPLSPDC